MAELHDDPEGLLGPLSSRSRVLLVNPPVEERRYNWLRWNQPADLLRLSTWLKRGSPKMDIRLFDFMLPNETGAVERRLVKDGNDHGLWHFGRRYSDFESWLAQLIGHDKWCPTLVLVTSLTSYWHVSVEKLVLKIAQTLGPKHRRKTRICLYGNYPRLEPEHAELRFADIAFTRSVDTTGCVPDHELYRQPQHGVLPQFAALDIRDPNVDEHIEQLLEQRDQLAKAAGNGRPQNLTIAFFNDDIGKELDGLKRLAQFVDGQSPRRIFVHGICGIRASSTTAEALEFMGRGGFRNLYVEHERTEGGGLDRESYAAIRDEFWKCRRARRLGEDAWLDRDGVTGFVNVGLPDDDMDRIVETTLELNEMFGAVIIKPWGWDPSVGPERREKREKLWKEPCESSPQWYPYAGKGSSLSADDYQNLMRWQSFINMRVKGMTFDFLDEGNIGKLVRETLTAESWKRRAS